jgi:4-amino-4-deoxy-L-arabinose transferase-like glycosyltransferase
MNSSSPAKAAAVGTLRKNIMAFLVSLLGTVVSLFPLHPGNMTYPSRDSGVFLYVGWRLLMGDVPYRDVWDHKPPLIYFVDALGIALTPDSLWGIWIVQCVFIFATFLVLYKALDHAFNTYAAIGGSILFASGLLTILSRGNVTEEYALLFQALCFLLIVKGTKSDFPTQLSFWIGVAGGLAFNFKQTTIGVLIAYGIFLLSLRLSQRKLPVRDFAMLFAGWLLPSLLVVIYFASRGALVDFWEQAYQYNFLYIGKHEGIRRLIPVFTKGFSYLQNGYMLHIAVLSWLVGCGYVWSQRRNFLKDIHPLITVALINLPVEVFMVLISGRSILHYYLTPLPTMAILTGVLIYTLPKLMARLPRLQRFQRWTPALLVAILLLSQYEQAKYYPDYVEGVSSNSRLEVVEFVVSHTKADDKVLIIGAESLINFLSRREAPTRYVYQFPLALTGRRPMFEEYFNQILANDPVLIIDTRGAETITKNLYTPLQKRSEIVRAGVEYLGLHYEKVAQFGEWAVYQKK